MSSKAVFRQYLASAIACLSMTMCGISYAWTSPVLPRLLKNDSEIEMTPDESSWVAASVEVGTLVSPIPFGSIVDTWGRKPCILLTGPVYILSWIIVLTTRSVFWLYVQRIIQGLGIGIMCTAVPVYAGEISQANIRGSTGALAQAMVYLGFVFCYCLGPYISYQAFAYANLGVAVFFVLTFMWMPESPYYFLMKNKEEEAAKALVWLYGEDDVSGVEKQLKEVKDSVEEDMKSKGRWWDLFNTGPELRALLIIQAALVAKHMSGYLGIVSYATKTFTAKGDSTLSGDEWAMLMGFILFLPMLIGAALVEKCGRRPLLMVSSLGCAVCDLCAAAYYYLETETDIYISQYSWIAFICIYGYCILFNIGLGPLVCVLKAEFFPSNTRGKASAISSMTETVACFFCIKLYQVLADGIGMYVNFLMFTGFCLFGSVLVYLYVPETTGMTFSEIQKQLHKGKTKEPHSERIVPLLNVAVVNDPDF